MSDSSLLSDTNFRAGANLFQLTPLYPQTYPDYGTYQGTCCSKRLLCTNSAQTVLASTKRNITKHSKQSTLTWDSYYKAVCKKPKCSVPLRRSSAKEKTVCILCLVTVPHREELCLAASARMTVSQGRSHTYRLTRGLFIQQRPFICFVIVRKLLLQVADKMQLLIRET